MALVLVIWCCIITCYKYNSLQEHTYFYYFKFLFIYLFLERRREGEREGEKHQCVAASRVPRYWGHGLEPRPGSWLGIELATPWFAGQCSIHWATPARAHIFNLIVFWVRNLDTAFLGCLPLVLHNQGVCWPVFSSRTLHSHLDLWFSSRVTWLLAEFNSLQFLEILGSSAFL